MAHAHGGIHSASTPPFLQHQYHPHPPPLFHPLSAALPLLSLLLCALRGYTAIALSRKKKPSWGVEPEPEQPRGTT